MNAVPSVTLNQSVAIPQLGFGVWQMDNSDVVRLVKLALDAGYRSIDTAALYGNEEGLGRAIEESDIDRHEIFITSKLDNASHGFDAARRAFDDSMRRLRLDVIDLYLIHWPMPKLDLYVETWSALRGPSIGRSCQSDRRFQLSDPAPPTAARGDCNSARDQPDRAAPHLSAGGACRLPPRARHCD